MEKRPQIKGRGADIYLGSEEKEMPATASTDIPTPAPKPSASSRRMLTTYLPPHLINRLHQEWLRRIQKDAKAQKAHIITEALERFLDELEADMKMSEQPNIEASKQPNV